MLKVTDSFTNEARTATTTQTANADGVVTYSFLVPSDDLIETPDQDVLLNVEVVGTGATRGGIRTSNAAVVVGVNPDSECMAALVAAGEVSLDGGPAPIATDLGIPRITDIDELDTASPPVATNDELAVMADDIALVDVLANDHDPDLDLDPTTLEIVTPPANGVATVVTVEDQVWISYSASGTTDSDQLEYKICDLTFRCSTATLTITVLTTSDCTIIGTEEADILYGTAAPDVICGFAGADTIYGHDGDDLIMAGRGDDTVYGGAGNDTIYGRRGNDTQRGGTGNDLIRGGRGSDTIIGGNGDDQLHGGAAPDNIRGNSGDDLIFGGSSGDTLRGNSGNDTIYGRRGNDDIFGGPGQDQAHGGKGKDQCQGVETATGCEL